MKRLRILILILAVAAYGIHMYKVSLAQESSIVYSDVIPDEWFETTGEILTPEADRRLADQTYLTFPEWFLVYSPEEQATFFKTNTSTQYSYSSQVNQFWDSYEVLQSKLENKYPYNDEYNTMIQVIGYSTQIEYDMKSWYETIIGRVTQTSTPTEEDIFYQQYTEDYAAFLNTAAWYDFDYKSQLKNLWTKTSLFGYNIHRKMERKYVLTSEILVKIAYAELIKFGSSSMYGEIATTTVIVTDSITDKMKLNETIEVISSSNGKHILRIPRYTAFMTTAQQIADENVNILEVAGNKSAILISLKVKKDTQFDKDKVKLLFGQQLANDREKYRIVLVTPIGNLANFMRHCLVNELDIEHVYDF